MEQYTYNDDRTLAGDGQRWMSPDANDGTKFYLASDVDARIAELEKALVDLVTGHNGYDKGLGPCICAAHEEARRVLGMTRDDVHQARSL